MEKNGEAAKPLQLVYVWFATQAGRHMVCANKEMMLFVLGLKA